MSLTDVPKDVVELVVIVRVTVTPRVSACGGAADRSVASPQAFAHDGVVVVPRSRADGDASLSL